MVRACWTTELAEDHIEDHPHPAVADGEAGGGVEAAGDSLPLATFAAALLLRVDSVDRLGSDADAAGGVARTLPLLFCREMLGWEGTRRAPAAVGTGAVGVADRWVISSRKSRTDWASSGCEVAGWAAVAPEAGGALVEGAEVLTEGVEEDSSSKVFIKSCRLRGVRRPRLHHAGERALTLVGLGRSCSAVRPWLRVPPLTSVSDGRRRRGRDSPLLRSSQLTAR
jgi:hypothetical protein